MKNIYDVDKKGLFKLLVNFQKCEYGKIQFILSYSVFLILFVLLVSSVIFYFQYKLFSLIIMVFLFALGTLISFILGSIHFYQELRYFSYNEKSSR
ncbi:MAG: hypothetical protein IJS56_06665 [Bacilli bacterium]|nr:hypothetical protein [Bacilli bacterium]